MAQRISPYQYFEEIPQQNIVNYTPLIIFGAICIVAITAMVIAYSRK